MKKFAAWVPERQKKGLRHAQHNSLNAFKYRIVSDSAHRVLFGLFTGIADAFLQSSLADFWGGKVFHYVSQNKDESAGERERKWREGNQKIKSE